MRILTDRVKQIAKNNPEGFSIYLPSCNPISSGWAVGMWETRNCTGKKGLLKAIHISLFTTHQLGGWLYNDKYYYDSIRVFHSKREAIQAGLLNSQLSIYNIENKEIICLNEDSSK